MVAPPVQPCETLGTKVPMLRTLRRRYGSQISSRRFCASGGDAALDVVALLNEWLAMQCRLLGDGLVQLAGSSLAVMTPCLGLQGELTQQCLTLAAQTMQQMREAGRDDKATDANAWAASSAALTQPWQRTLGDWWPQWSAFWMRGMEQLA